MKTLETERLILRPFKKSDLDDFYEYCRMDTVGPNAGWSAHTCKDHSLKIIENFIEKDDVLALYHKTDKKVIGSIGLHKKETIEGSLYYELGYVLSTDYEGKGIMTEAVRRVLDHAFLELMIDEIYVCHFIENHKSQRVIEKCGFDYLQSIEYETVDFGKKKSSLYHLTKNKYLK
ncbi:MAG TPA: GNAT family N-acetyltransferase [Bacillota bacterium]|nr:GNAT family N-acetyltransferase [Bacillota bacterium]